MFSDQGGKMQSIRDILKNNIPCSWQGPIKKIMSSRFYKMIDPKWHRYAVGGQWEEMGGLQFDFLRSQGLEPKHYFLDVGCGCLRGGVHFIEYLDKGHYYGIDKDNDVLSAGRDRELKKYDLENKEPLLKQMQDFGFSRLGQKFDYALAESVFTHIPLNDIVRCLINIEQVLVEGGKFYATFFENKDGKSNLAPITQSNTRTIVTYYDKDPFHYSYETFQGICEDTKLMVEYIGEWGHPVNQKMMVFTKT